MKSIAGSIVVLGACGLLSMGVAGGERTVAFGVGGVLAVLGLILAFSNAPAPKTD